MPGTGHGHANHREGSGMLKRIILLCSLALAAVAPAMAAKAPIKIGAILPLTGSGASYGVWMKGGVEIAAEEINAAGGIDGHKLEVIYEDHAADASKAVNAMRRLVQVENVPFVLTSYSAITLAVQPIGVQNKVVMMNGGGQSDHLANKPYLYNNIPVVSTEVAPLCDWLVKGKHFRSAVMIVANDEAGRNAAKSFRERFQADGGRVLGEEFVALDGNDFRAQLAKLKARGGDVLFISSYGRNVAIIANQAREIGMRTPMAATSWVLIPEVESAKGAQGMIVTHLPFDASSTFAKKFKERYGTDAGFFAVQYYNATKIFATAAEAAMKKHGGKLDGPGIRDAIESIRAFDTISGRLVFQPDHAALMDIEVGELKDGRFQPEKLIKAEH
ncbi:MAG: ABC transporter substrate-binding protein [Betaproteobacteria bacterium]|nr:ABC transporter substrate-binding protein [Betaproteobacteria bacterium]